MACQSANGRISQRQELSPAARFAVCVNPRADSRRGFLCGAGAYPVPQPTAYCSEQVRRSIEQPNPKAGADPADDEAEHRDQESSRGGVTKPLHSGGVDCGSPRLDCGFQIGSTVRHGVSHAVAVRMANIRRHDEVPPQRLIGALQMAARSLVRSNQLCWLRGFTWLTLARAQISGHCILQRRSLAAQ